MKHYITEINPNGTIAVDDTILVKEYETTAGSKILEGFVPLFSAEAVERLINAGYEISGKTNVGEFGLDLLGEFSNSGAVCDGEYLVGAAADLIAKGEIKGALSVDLNGALRRAAAISGIDFIKPTYGTVSRYGVIPCACSGEQIGVSASNADGLKELLSVIAGHDDKDGTSLPAEKYEYSLDENVSGMKIAVIRELYDKASDGVRAGIDSFKEKLTAVGAQVEEITFSLVEAAQTAWQIALAAETCNNVSRYEGVKFGYRTPNYKNIDELYVNSRTEGMNFLSKAAILYGSDVLSKGRYNYCYDKTLKIRRVVHDAVKAVFSEYDAILAPACGETAYVPYDIKDAFSRVFAESIFTAVPNLTGIPALVTNGVQLMADVYRESVLLSIAKSAEGRE